MTSKFLAILTALIILITMASCGTFPKNEKDAADEAFNNAALGKDCDKENYLATEQLRDKAYEELSKKEYEKAKKLFKEVKEKSEAILKYYQTHPDQCLPKEKKCNDNIDNDGDGLVDCDDDDCSQMDNCTKPIVEDVVEELPDEKDPNWKFPVIHFEFNKHEIRYEDQALIEKMSRWLQNFESVSLRIEGHADERGSIDYNMSLGEKRAREVQKQLIMLGINKSRFEIISYGEEQPVDMGQTEEAWFKNRRAEFKRVN